MARSDLLLSLVRAGNNGDSRLFRAAAEAIIAEERTKRHYVFANALTEALKAPQPAVSNNGSGSARNLFYESAPQETLDEMVLPAHVRRACDRLIEEQHRAELLRSYNLEPRHRILLLGAPGTGKTSLASALTNALMVPLITVRYEGLIGSYLGETATRLRALFEHIRTYGCVLFFDEFDTIGKERGDTRETGEIKRVVSSLLLQIDSLPSHVVVVTATNHPELLDRAVWRRFQLRLKLPMPSDQQIREWLARVEARGGTRLGSRLDQAVHFLQGLSFAELADFTSDLQRCLVLDGTGTRVSAIIDQLFDERKDWARGSKGNGE
jgi:SpoVK/Ycf46/Vps4 family AAA+-type ATPase